MTMAADSRAACSSFAPRSRSNSRFNAFTGGRASRSSRMRPSSCAMSWIMGLASLTLGVRDDLAKHRGRKAPGTQREAQAQDISCVFPGQVAYAHAQGAALGIHALRRDHRERLGKCRTDEIL